MENKTGNEGEFNLLRFKLHNERSFGVDVAKLRNIVKTPSINEIPSLNNFMVGVIQDRGQTIPVIDTSMALGFEKSPVMSDDEKLVIVADFKDEAVGFLILEANEIVRVSNDMISKNYSESGADNLLEMIINTDDGLLSTIDLNSIIEKVGV